MLIPRNPSRPGLEGWATLVMAACEMPYQHALFAPGQRMVRQHDYDCTWSKCSVTFLMYWCIVC